MNPSAALPAAAVLTTLACVLLGTGRIVRRVWLDDWPSRIRSVLWGSIPAFIGGLLGYFDGTGKDDFVGLILTLGLACLGSMIAVVLWIPSNTRDAIGTAVFELTAALVWGYISVVAITSALTAPQM